MSLELSRSNPNVSVKTFGPLGQREGRRAILFGEYDVDYEDFCAAFEYFLTNDDIYEGDPRLAFLERLKKAEIGPGWGARMWSKDEEGTEREVKIDGKRIHIPMEQPPV